MKILILTHDEVTQLLPMPECIAAMEEALSALARGEMDQPLRMVFRPAAASGVMAMMPSYKSGSEAVFGLKAICVFPDNPTKGKDAHQGGVLLFSGETGEPLALMNASAITAIRTAAVSGVATRLLARDEARKLAIIGAGVQARSHLTAMAHVRAITSACIASRTFAHAQAFVDEMQSSCAFPLEAVESVRAAVTGADIIVTATTATEPVLQREWIAAGTHINAVGTFSPAAREIDTATMAAASLFVDRRQSALNEAGDYLLAAGEGAFGPNHIRAEVGEVLKGAAKGRTTSDEITLFKSLGLAIEDLAAAAHLYRKAQQEHCGSWVEF
ncbi:MAG TPA: ornithine cyclodeaminase family protein [Pyrinomonadaceae bacterium]|nr:ornithine cyclodeaminase family protein [Pyrinomonadaceae bacterium]